MIYLIRSILTFLLLYGMAALVADRVHFHSDLSVTLGVQIGIALLLLQYLLGPVLIRLFLDIDWDTPLPARNQQFLEDLCQREGLPLPRAGIIHGSMPNAFTFGRIQSDASIVVTTGLLEALTPEESNAVTAHEAGHIKHWDFLALTAASVVPLLLYQLYATARRFKDDHWAPWIAYAAYWVSEYLVLWLSRTREFWADDFAARATGEPALLSSGLVKICYGMAKVERQGQWAREHGSDEEKQNATAQSHLARKIGVMGISTGEVAFALSGSRAESASAMMRWDLENPWARIYELNSTHPLTAFRIQAMNKLSEVLHKPMEFPLPANTRIRWGNFPLEVLLCATPWVAGFLLLSLSGLDRRGVIELPVLALPLLALALAAAWIGRIFYRYQGAFTLASIRELAADVMPSNIRPRAVALECEIVGRGEPEAFWSPDLVLKDETGIVFMLDRQSIPFARAVYAQSADALIGQRVTVRGWYRRGPMPYVEMSAIYSETGELLHNTRSRWIQLGLAALGSTAILLLSAFLAR